MTSLHWSTPGVRLKGYTHASRGKATTVKVELEVADPWALASLLEQLAEAQKEERPTCSKPREPIRAAVRMAAPRRALPPSEMELLKLPAPEPRS